MESIRITGLQFYAFHGCHQEERKLGAQYQVDIEIFADLKHAGETDQVRDTVNYEEVIQQTASIMSKPVNLLETLALQIGKTLKNEHSLIQKVTVEVAKLNPPLGQQLKKVSVIQTI